MAIRIFTEEEYDTYFPKELFSGLKTYIATQYQVIEEFYTDHPLSCIHIGLSDHLEYKISSLLKGEWVGKGNGAVDVIYDKIDPDGTIHKIGIDIKSVTAKNPKSGCTNETSLVQDFKTVGKTLENDIRDRKIDKIRDEWHY